MLRPCLGIDGIPCGELTPSPRCPEHQKAWERSRPSRRALGRYDARHTRLAKQVVREQPWCSQCKTPGSEDNPLQGDHILPHSRGGRNVRSNYQTLCRRCNAAKRDRILGKP